MAQNPHETQQSVSEWCDEHYPGFSEQAKFLDLVEEVAELGAVMGIPEDIIIERLRKSLEKSRKDFGDRTQILGEIGDVQIATLWLANEVNVTAQDALDVKMGKNRAKRPSESQARLQAKAKIFDGPKGL